MTDTLRALGAVEDLHSIEYVVPPRTADGRAVLLWAGHGRRWVGTWPRLSGESFDGVSNVTSATRRAPRTRPARCPKAIVRLLTADSCGLFADSWLTRAGKILLDRGKGTGQRLARWCAIRDSNPEPAD
jgi:hypothetical protein